MSTRNGSGSDQRNERKIGSNKLLEARKRYSAPTPIAGSALGTTAKMAAAGGVGPMRTATASRHGPKEMPFGKCKVCKVTVAKEGAKYCQKCAYKQGEL